MPVGPDKYLATFADDTATDALRETQQSVFNAGAPGGEGASDAWLKWAVFMAFQTRNITTWNGELEQSGTAVWPDGEVGVYTAEDYDLLGFGALLIYKISHPASTKTVRVTSQLDEARLVVHNAVASIVT